jgi:hypothetical protein
MLDCKIKPFLVVIVFPFIFWAQTDGEIKGKLKDTEDKPVELANLSLLHKKDSTFIKGAISDTAGFFNFNKLMSGDYLLLISHISYQKKWLNISVNSKSPQVSLGDVILDSNFNGLEEVTVTYKKPLFEKSKDRVTFNVQESVVNSLQSNMIGLLTNLPGVWIDRQNNILLNGQEKVLVTINGKAQYLSNSDLIQRLSGIPVNSIEKIEIIANPGAKYDAEGSAVINIITKTKVDSGFTGTVNAQYGESPGYNSYNPRINTGLNLSYGVGKISVFGSYNYRYAESLRRITENIDFGDRELNQSIMVNSIPVETHTLEAGINYDISDSQSLSLFYNKNDNSDSVRQANAINLVNATEPDEDVLSEAKEKITSNQDALNFSYVNQLDSVQMLSLGSDLILLDKKQLSDYENTFEVDNNGSTEILRNLSESDIRVWVNQVDYSIKWHQNHNLEAGVKYSDIKTENSVDFETLVNNVFEPDDERSNAFDYQEDIFAAYLNSKNTFGKLDITAGLRYETSTISGKSPVDQFGFERNFTGFFPSISLYYQWNDNLGTSLAYSRRINRPDYVDINPFIYYLNPFTQVEGNPTLIPSITNKYQLSFQIKQMYSMKLMYYKTTNIFTLAQFQDTNTREQRLIPTNIGDLSHFELNMGAPITFSKWWEGYFDVSLFHQKYDEDTSTGLGFGSISRTTFQFYAQQSFSLPKDITLELVSTIVTPSVQGQFRFSTIYFFSGGLSKSFLKDKLTLKIGFDDILRTLRYKGRLEGPGWISNYTDFSDSRQVTFGLTYNFFKKGKEVKSANPEWISDEEKKRL